MLSNVANEENLIFSLDIGTRTVIGIVGTWEDGKFRIITSCIKSHEKRNMYDGQIHDIEGVTKIVREVKEELESRLKISLKKVCIAAAGRSLRTCRVKIDKKIEPTIEIDNRMIEALELEGIQRAQELVDDENYKKDMKYYCIGYSVVNYYLDDSFIENLEGHRAEKIGVDILATFLPQIVLDSLYTVMSRANLEVANITLEPIAAINIAIKENLRLLNLALVDIGAGTSDIAITKDGTISAYAMTSTAGDELTEKIAKTYLLDFDTSEKLKVRLNKENNHEFYDIVGVKHNLTTDEIISEVDDAIDKIAKEICEKIIEFNGKSPSAVFLIGGSSQIPHLTEKISKYLKIPVERVVIRDASIIENVEGITDDLKGPDAITPIGIGMIGAYNEYNDFLKVYLDEKELAIFNSSNMKVVDALLLANYSPNKLVPKRGEDFIYYLNGEKVVEKGKIGEPAIIYINGEVGSLNTKISDGDKINIISATKGERATPKLFDCGPKNETIKFNDKTISLIQYKVNGKHIKDNIKLNHLDKVGCHQIKDIEELLDYIGFKIDDYIVYKNGIKVNGDSCLEKGDVIVSKLKGYEKDQTNSYLDSNQKSITLTINGEKKIFSYDKDKFVFVDIFSYIDFDLSKAKGRLVLKVNGQKAQYIQELKDNDIVEIYWEK